MSELSLDKVVTFLLGHIVAYSVIRERILPVRLRLRLRLTILTCAEKLTSSQL